MKRPSGKRLTAIVALGAAVYTAGTLFQPAVVVGDSMAPTLHDGKLIYVDRTYYGAHAPRAGEVVVFEHDGGVYIKRVYRGPGETLHYVSDGIGFVRLVSEDKLDEARRRYQGNQRTALRVISERVPADSVWVLGDNFSRSEDSRVLGPIPIRELIGRARLPVDTTLARRHEYRPRKRRDAPHTVVGVAPLRAWHGS